MEISAAIANKVVSQITYKQLRIPSNKLGSLFSFSEKYVLSCGMNFCI